MTPQTDKQPSEVTLKNNMTHDAYKHVNKTHLVPRIRPRAKKHNFTTNNIWEKFLGVSSAHCFLQGVETSRSEFHQQFQTHHRGTNRSKQHRGCAHAPNTIIHENCWSWVNDNLAASWHPEQITSSNNWITKMNIYNRILCIVKHCMSFHFTCIIYHRDFD